jgi:hypothetical protein
MGLRAARHPAAPPYDRQPEVRVDYVKTARAGARLAVKYGPQAKLAWDRGGKQAAAVARKRAVALVAARKAYAEAETVRDGSVLRHVVDGTPVHVVFTGDQPVHAYPPQPGSLETFIKDLDLDLRVTPEEHRQRQLRVRATRLASRGRYANASWVRASKESRTGRSVPPAP